MSGRANRMIEDMCRRPETIERLNADPEKVFEEYRLSEEEKQALRAGDPASLGRVGIHPLLQMHYGMARRPEMAHSMSIAEYPDLLED